MARTLAQRLSEQLKQPFVIENKPGAGGNIGTESVVRAPADGYTLIVNSVGPMAVNPTLYKNLPYNPLTDLVPIAQISDVPNVLVVHPSTQREGRGGASSPTRKANPGKLNYASTGIGTSSHLSSFMLASRAGFEATHVPYKGAEALKDLLAGPHPVHVRDHPLGDPAHQGGQPHRDRACPARSARARCPTCRRSPSRASRASRRARGSASSRPRARRAEVIAELNSATNEFVAEKAVDSADDRGGRRSRAGDAGAVRRSSCAASTRSGAPSCSSPARPSTDARRR